MDNGTQITGGPCSITFFSLKFKKFGIHHRQSLFIFLLEGSLISLLASENSS
jgi:hypothetical protein